MYAKNVWLQVYAKGLRNAERARKLSQKTLISAIVSCSHGDPVTCVDFGERVDDVSTEEWVNVFWEELCTRWSILRPVGVITYSVVGITTR